MRTHTHTHTKVLLTSNVWMVGYFRTYSKCRKLYYTHADLPCLWGTEKSVWKGTTLSLEMCHRVFCSSERVGGCRGEFPLSLTTLFSSGFEWQVSIIRTHQHWPKDQLSSSYIVSKAFWPPQNSWMAQIWFQIAASFLFRQLRICIVPKTEKCLREMSQ